MKKNLSLLTRIVFLITILAAGGCGGGKKQNAPIPFGVDSKEVYIYLKAVLIDSSMHLEMYDSKKPDCNVIDGLLTVVDPGDTVEWKKAPQSNISKIVAIIPKEDPGNIFGNLDRVAGPDSLWTLEIPLTAEPDTVPYGIEFSVPKYGDSIFIVDPYLRIPPPN